MNIFEANSVPVQPDHDPRVIFLRTLATEYSSAAHMGGLAVDDLVDNSKELFGPPDGESRYVRTPVGLHIANFYSLDNWPAPPAYFFPNLQPSFGSIKTPDGVFGVPFLLEFDALAVYIALKEPVEKLQRIALQPFPGEREWFQVLSQMSTLIVMTGSDGDFFQIYTLITFA